MIVMHSLGIDIGSSWWGSIFDFGEDMVMFPCGYAVLVDISSRMYAVSLRKNSRSHESLTVIMFPVSTSWRQKTALVEMSLWLFVMFIKNSRQKTQIYSLPE